ncbi:hypothetical protein HI914_05722 [Erysiphe necator]|nr:hypothetical protein HI914_05722 [Erysiphe necator]
MSGTAAPISLASFGEALKSLTIESLYSKVNELENSIAHLKDSNQQLKSFTQGMISKTNTETNIDHQLILEHDQECIDAIQENVMVITRFQDRIKLLVAEIEARGLGLQITTSSTTQKEKKTSLTSLANNNLRDVSISHLEDGVMVKSYQNEVAEKIPEFPSNHHDIDAMELMTDELIKIRTQGEFKISQEISSNKVMVGNTESEEGIYL